MADEEYNKSDESEIAGRMCDREHIGCGGLCKIKGNATGSHAAPHGCNKCGAAF